jgi:hypothetical protein
MRLQHAITSRRTPWDQCDPYGGMNINALNRITKVVDEVYANFGVVDAFASIVSFEDSIEIFHCFAPDSKMYGGGRPDYKVYNNSFLVFDVE